MTVLVTGATGFVGASLRDALRRRGFVLRLATHRNALKSVVDETVHVGDIHGGTDWSTVVSGVSTIIHLAARVHVMREKAPDALSAFRRVNTMGTEMLARAAARAGVRRLVYVSSIKVNGEVTGIRPFSRIDRPNPGDPYAVSKWEAEIALAQVARETGLEVVIVRPPLVYGPGVRGNFLRLLKLSRLGIPLPFGSAQNRRSLVFVRNLADVLVTCATHPNAVGQTFLVSDGEDLSTAELCVRLARAQKRNVRLWRVPAPAVRVLAFATRRSADYQRLFSSLQVDSSPLRAELEWMPPFSVDDGIAETVAWAR